MFKPMMYSYKLLAVLFVMGLMLGACASSAPVEEAPPAAEEPEEPVVTIPAGVDSASAFYASALADESFVSFALEERAREHAAAARALVSASDTLWTYLTVAADTAQDLSVEEETAAIRAFNRGAEALAEYAQISQAEDISEEILRSMQADLLDEAQAGFEEAIQIDPYDEDTRFRLAQVYSLQADRLGRAEAYEEAITILERLVRLRPDQHGLFAALANNYYAVEEWTAAAEAYSQAAEVHLESVELALEPGVEPDSSLLFQYAMAEADAYVYGRRADPALAAYDKAEQVATTEEDSAFVAEEIEWVRWDDGNIANSFARDSLVQLVDTGAYEEARQGFTDLRSSVETQDARDWTDWRLALVEYEVGDRDTAADRLQALVERTEREDNGAPADESYQRYFDAYGTICYNLGLEYLGERRDNRTALKYFEQSTRVPWNGQARAALEAAQILRNNVRQAVEYAEMAAEKEDQLSAEDRQVLFRTLVDYHRRMGNREEAAHYAERYRSLQSASDA